MLLSLLLLLVDVKVVVTGCIIDDKFDVKYELQKRENTRNTISNKKHSCCRWWRWCVSVAAILFDEERLLLLTDRISLAMIDDGPV